jgi:hypothetical protein
VPESLGARLTYGGVMNRWQAVVKEGVITGSAASALSTLALAYTGKRQAGSAKAPTNATSHWIWGGEALRENKASWRHTGVGFLIHHASSILWGVLYAQATHRVRGRQRVAPALIGGASAAAVACFVDYRLTPKSLTPGFEHRLSTLAMLGVYGAFGLGLALATVALGRRQRQGRP